MQVVSIGDTVSIGVNGEIRGGSGAEYGGDALILMDATAASSVNLSGSLIGGNASSRGGEPGQSLLVVGDSVSHARVVNCLLQDGENTFSYDTVITPLPEITSSVETVDPLLTPMPELTPEPTPEHTHAPQPTPEPSFTPIPATPDEASPAE